MKMLLLLGHDTVPAVVPRLPTATPAMQNARKATGHLSPNPRSGSTVQRKLGQGYRMALLRYLQMHPTASVADIARASVMGRKISANRVGTHIRQLEEEGYVVLRHICLTDKALEEISE